MNPDGGEATTSKDQIFKSMRARKLHRIIGVVLLLPFFGWALTGIVFFFKPGYEGAYEIISLKFYPLSSQSSVVAQSDWLEMRLVKTILGEHLLVKRTDGWSNLDPITQQPKTPPSEAEFRSLLKDAFGANPTRYGEIVSVNGTTATTNTGVEVTLDWKRMSLQQKGTDTARIDWLYRIHYLQWTGYKTFDRVVGMIGILLVLTLTSLGAWLAFRRG